MDKDLKLFLGCNGFNKIQTCIQLNGGKNNKVYKIIFADQSKIIIKKYYSNLHDKRNRLLHEWQFLSHAIKINPICVPQPITFNENLGIASFSYVSGRKFLINEIDKIALKNAGQFIKKLNETPFNNKFQNASENCLLLEDHISNIDKRIINLADSINTNYELDAKIFDLIKVKIVPLWNKIRVFNQKSLANNKHKIKQFLSPSDFGFHNILRTPETKLFFLDFEYSGMDDLVKLTNDFFCVPEIPINEKYYNFFISEMTNNLDLDTGFIFRAKNLLYSYKLKWICIMLKQITINGIEKRSFLNMSNSKKVHNKQLNVINSKIKELENKFNLETL